MVATTIQRIYSVDTRIKKMAMESTIRKWGNSPAVRLPTAVLKAAAFSLEQKVTLHVTRGRIIIEPSDKVEYDLDKLLDGITAKNLHKEASFGKRVGKEIL
jgi:antitoxin MazE